MVLQKSSSTYVNQKAWGSLDIEGLWTGTLWTLSTLAVWLLGHCFDLRSVERLHCVQINYNI